MAKKKKKKDNKKKSNGYEIELQGLIIILITIIGFGRFGIVGKLVSSFASFLVGAWYNVLLVALFIIGAYMIIKRARPDYFTSKLFGIYVFCIGILVFSHIGYVNETGLRGFQIVKETVDNFLASTTSISNIQGGGLIGSIFTALFVELFDIEGTQIVSWTLLIGGFVMFTGISIADMIRAMIDKTKDTIKNSKGLHKKDKEDIKKAEDEYESDGKVVISSVDELIHETANKPKEEPKINVNEQTGEIIENKGYKFPPITLLNPAPKKNNKANEEVIKDNVKSLVQVLTDFGITGKVVAAHIGPTVTQYELEIKAGTKVSKILGINREIALALAAKDVRIEAPIPGKKTIGIEILNKVTSMVSVR